MATPPPDVLAADDPAIYAVRTVADGPTGALPLTDRLLRESPSGDLFGLSQNVGMGWAAAGAADTQFLILSTQGGVRAPDGSPVALGYHTGHWEIGLLVQAAAEEFRRLGAIPFAGFCSDPCDGRTQGTTGMFDSLPYRNDAAIVLRRLARSLPRRAGMLGHCARYSRWDTAGKRAASWSGSAHLHEQPDQAPGHPVAPRGPVFPPAATSVVAPRRHRSTRSCRGISRAGSSGVTRRSGPCRATSRRNSAAISSAASSASDSPVLGAPAATRGSSSPSPARAAASARPATAATWPRPPPTSPTTSFRR